MFWSRVVCIAVAVLCFAAVRADASCPITLEGNAVTVDPIRAELGAFTEDGSPCVALWVACRKTGDQLEIELHDELGRSSERMFASPGGAAAFIVSWARRPLLPNLAAIQQAAPAIASSSRTASSNRSWHPELGLAYLNASGHSSGWAVATVSVLKRASIWRYGGTLRGMLGGNEGLYHQFYVNTEAEATFGVAHEPFNRVTVHGEVIAGGSLITFTNEANPADYGARGPRIGARTTLGWQLRRSLLLEISIGYDFAWQSVEHEFGVYDDVVGFRYAAGGVRWTL